MASGLYSPCGVKLPVNGGQVTDGMNSLGQAELRLQGARVAAGGGVLQRQGRMAAPVGTEGDSRAHRVRQMME